MKILIFSIMILLTFSFSKAVSARTIVVEQTEDWTAVPIDVDVEKHTYVMPHYYYHYRGHRCFAEKRTYINIAGITFSSGGNKIYCYSEEDED